MKTALRLAAAALPLWSASAAGAPAGGDFQQAVVPALERHCLACHGGAKKKGGLDLEVWTRKDEATASRAVQVWQTVLGRLEAGEMPPEERPRPSPDERQAMIRWMRAALGHAAEQPADPGRVTMRRLNRVEYNNTIRDLLGVDLDPARDFPPDDVGYGFDNIGDVLSLPPVLVERYLLAAERIAKRTIVAEVPPRSRRQTFQIERLAPTPPGSRIAGPDLVLSSDGSVAATHEFPVTGDYRLKVRAHGRHRTGQTPRLAIRVDGAELAAFQVSAPASAPALYSLGATIPGGPHRIELALTNAGPIQVASGMPARTLALDSLVVEGPLPGTWRLPESHRQLIPHTPAAKGAQQAARELLEPLATRAFRRPATAPELERLARFVDDAVARGETFEQGMQMALRAMLVSPHFLFRVEVDDRPSPGTEVRTLGDWALASRLSYFLWSSMPDEELFGLARNGRLREAGVLEAQVKRMLRDPRSKALAENFAPQWLQIRSLPTLRRPKRQFPAFDDDLRAAMARESELFFAEVMRLDLDVSTFLDADFTFLNEPLARHYGIPHVDGKEFRRVALANGRRGGVLTQASVLTVTSNPTRTSPVKRGRWVLEQLLGTPPPPPPPGVPDLKDRDARRDGPTTMRQRLEQHRRDPACAVCHKKLDPLGFGLENFDAVGTWRTEEGGAPVDASGVLPDGQKFNGVQELKSVLLSKKALFRRSLASKLLTYALGRGTEAFDRPAVDRICEQMDQHGNRFSSLVTAIATSDPFQKARAVAPELSSEVQP